MSPFLLLPRVDEELYLLKLWEEAGSVETNGMGISKLSWEEIRAWLDVRNRRGEMPLSSFEIETVRELSEEYVSEYYAASDTDREPPYGGESIEQLDRDAVAKKVSNVFDAFKRDKDEPKYIVEEPE